MSSTLKNLALFVALLLLVLLASWFYIRDQDLARPRSGAVVTAPPAAERVPDDVHPDLAAGIQAIQSGKWNEARQQLARVPEQDPSYTLALQKLGVAAWELRDYQAAYDAFRRLSEIQPENANVYVDLASAQFRLGRVPAAENTVLRALEIDPGHLAARYNVAFYRVARGDLVRAIPAYNRAIRADTQNAHLARALQDLLDLHGSGAEIGSVHYAIAFFAKMLSRRDLEIEELEHFLATAPAGPAADVARERLAEARESLETK